MTSAAPPTLCTCDTWFPPKHPMLQLHCFCTVLGAHDILAGISPLFMRHYTWSQPGNFQGISLKLIKPLMITNQVINLLSTLYRFFDLILTTVLRSTWSLERLVAHQSHPSRKGRAAPSPIFTSMAQDPPFISDFPMGKLLLAFFFFFFLTFVSCDL